MQAMRYQDSALRVRAEPLPRLGERYRRYRLADPLAEEAMAGSLKRWGQLSPVVACVCEEQLELLDGFKRLGAARQIAGWTSLNVHVLEVDERTAKAAILGLNRGQRPVRELEEAWIVQALVRDDGLTQVEAAHLLGQHKSWVCRRPALEVCLTEHYSTPELRTLAYFPLHTRCTFFNSSTQHFRMSDVSRPSSPANSKNPGPGCMSPSLWTTMTDSIPRPAASSSLVILGVELTMFPSPSICKK
jgi:hypothetical protein